MANFSDYIEWRGDIDFATSPFNEIDALILEQIEYNNIDGLVQDAFTAKGITLRELGFRFATAPDFTKRSDVGAVINPLTPNVLQQASESLRFGSLRLCGYVNKIDTRRDEQFSAVTFVFDDNSFFVAYRGTDDTIVGWKEDFDLGWKDKVPAQEDALLYLEQAAKNLHGKIGRKKNGDIMVGGHSKGGNLAIYSAAHASRKTKDRIIAIYNHEGPGFDASFFKTDCFLEIRSRVFTFVPQLSVIGMLFSHPEDFVTVESDQKGIMQHDPFSWHVSAHHFVERPDTDEESKIISRTVNGWFNELDIKQKELFVETVFGLLKDTNAKTNSELTANWWNNMLKMLKAMNQLDPKTRDMVFKTLQLFVKCARNSVYENTRTALKRGAPVKK